MSGTFIDYRHIGRSGIHRLPVMSGANARSRNLPGSFNGFLAETGNSETDPVSDMFVSGGFIDRCEIVSAFAARLCRPRDTDHMIPHE